MNGFVKGGLVLGGTVLGLGALRRLLNPSPRYQAWEKPPYERFENKVLVVGGGFGGYTTATKLCKLTKGREDVGSWSSLETTSLPSGRWCRGSSAAT
jgi:NADH dehydrogenase